MEEIWKDIDGYEGYYLVSNYGRIKSLGKGKNRNVRVAILTNNVNYFGYERVNLWKDKKCKPKTVHRLVASAFIPNPENKRTINHINGIKTDNRVENLEWNTHSENHIHAFKIGLRVGPKKYGPDNHKSKPIIQIDLFGNVKCEYSCQKEAQRITGIKQGDISRVCNGIRPTAGGFKWAFK